MAQSFLGEISPVAFPFAPRGWAMCAGQVMAISQNQALFSLLGTTYGGDGVSTFALPKAKKLTTTNKIPLTQCINVEGIFPSFN